LLGIVFAGETARTAPAIGRIATTWRAPAFPVGKLRLLLNNERTGK
jgi:hypothetical protein